MDGWVDGRTDGWTAGKAGRQPGRWASRAGRIRSYAAAYTAQSASLVSIVKQRCNKKRSRRPLTDEL